jgi:hypothetical protein
VDIAEASFPRNLTPIPKPMPLLTRKKIPIQQTDIVTKYTHFLDHALPHGGQSLYDFVWTTHYSNVHSEENEGKFMEVPEGNSVQLHERDDARWSRDSIRHK